MGEHSISAVAYAYDIALFTKSSEGIQILLDTTVEYLASVGLKMSVLKCGGFHVETTKDAWVYQPLNLTIQASRDKSFGVAEAFVYLGLTFTVMEGIWVRQHLDTLLDSAARVRRLVKPQKKVMLLMQYMVPTFAPDSRSTSTLRTSSGEWITL